MLMNSNQTNAAPWKEIVARYQRPAAGRAIWQILNTLVPYAALWYCMYRSLAVSIWLTLPLVVLAGAFLVRIFIIFHDCTHGCFFRSRRANEWVGSVMGGSVSPPSTDGAGNTQCITPARATSTGAAPATCGP
jgi:fatty acid desaturase